MSQGTNRDRGSTPPLQFLIGSELKPSDVTRNAVTGIWLLAWRMYTVRWSQFPAETGSQRSVTAPATRAYFFSSMWFAHLQKAMMLAAGRPSDAPLLFHLLESSTPLSRFLLPVSLLSWCSAVSRYYTLTTTRVASPHSDLCLCLSCHFSVFTQEDRYT